MTIFVFGSNLAGKHYGGAAKYAPLFRGAPANCQFDPLWARFGYAPFTEAL